MLKIEQLAELVERNRPAIQARVREFSIGDKFFAFNSRPAIMGVVNLSPDSWYRESVCLSADRAIQRGNVLSAQGADIVDIGAESTLAQASLASATDQMKKLMPVVSGLSAGKVLVSIETYESAVALAGLEAGARVINFTGMKPSEAMLAEIAAREAALIICYVQGENVRAVGDFDFGKDPVAMMEEFFAGMIERATRLGVDRIILDPGLGFYYRNLQDSVVRIRHQMNIFLNTFRLRRLGCPICHALPHAFEFFGEEVRCAEPFFAVLASLGKTDLFRTHEVPRIKAVIETLAAF
ncbi:MAG: dihydropteroate synthase [Candidatus Omnitrophica bacterium]|nr:dihydropteroate synthase [Candidatus Omnitrophota bacterium]